MDGRNMSFIPQNWHKMLGIPFLLDSWVRQLGFVVLKNEMLLMLPAGPLGGDLTCSEALHLLHCQFC